MHEYHACIYIKRFFYRYIYIHIFEGLCSHTKSVQFFKIKSIFLSFDWFDFLKKFGIFFYCCLNRAKKNFFFLIAEELNIYIFLREQGT